jgi:hypothetical protein
MFTDNMTERKPIETIVVPVSLNDLFPSETRWREVEGRMAPRADFYNSDPRAKQIRDVCVQLTTNLARLLWDKTAKTDEARQTLEADMLACGEQLTLLGITPSMNMRRKQQTYHRNPVIFAEYVAGQLLPYSGHKTRSEEAVIPLEQEFEVEDGIVDTSNGLPSALEDFYVDGWIVKNAMDFLDCKEVVMAQFIGTD